MGNADQREQVEGFPLFAAKALLASNSASAGSRVLEVIDSFINLFPFLSRKTSGTVSSHQTLRHKGKLHGLSRSPTAGFFTCAPQT
jgi:hypothetical protein